ncbi:hypothetical protein V5279_35945 [Bradyrhizobium sp. 26S5]|uniref:hypothetical protein n=1 Tax=Bradyrhizobium sp. 26S5 TaxID=3139729 RepID=UPI0030CCD331
MELAAASARHATEHPFTQSSVPIATRNDKIGAFGPGQPDEVLCVWLRGVDANLELAIDAVPFKVARDIAQAVRGYILLIRRADFGDCHLRSPDQEGRRVSNRLTCRAGVFPTDDDAVGR